MNTTAKHKLLYSNYIEWDNTELPQEIHQGYISG